MILTMCQEQGAQPHTFSSISRQLGNKTPVEVRWGGSQGDGERRREDGTNGVYSHKELLRKQLVLLKLGLRKGLACQCSGFLLLFSLEMIFTMSLAALE